MTWPLRLDPDRFFPADPPTRSLSRRLFAEVEHVPILSPHGHSDPAWFAFDQPFEDAVSLLLWPDHYLLRLLFSQGVSLESLGLQPSDDAPFETDRRAIWRRFADQYRLFRGTPSRLWLDHVFAEVFGIEARKPPITISTPSAPLWRKRHSGLARSSSASASRFWQPPKQRSIRSSIMPPSGPLAGRGRVITTFRPDDVVDPDRPRGERE